MQGMLGGLPPGLAGYVAADQMRGQKQAQQLAQMQGLLGVQNAVAEQQVMPLKLEMLRQQIATAKTKAEKDAAMLAARGSLFAPGEAAPGAPTANQAFAVNPEAVARYLSLGGDPKTIE